MIARQDKLNKITFPAEEDTIADALANLPKIVSKTLKSCTGRQGRFCF